MCIKKRNDYGLTGLSREARVMNLKNNSHPDDIEVTDLSAFVNSLMTSCRVSLSSDTVSAVDCIITMLNKTNIKLKSFNKKIMAVKAILGFKIQ